MLPAGSILNTVLVVYLSQKERWLEVGIYTIACAMTNVLAGWSGKGTLEKRYVNGPPPKGLEDKGI